MSKSSMKGNNMNGITVLPTWLYCLKFRSQRLESCSAWSSFAGYTEEESASPIFT
jgi:hypothetical protein